jgi:hypothetical protein
LGNEVENEARKKDFTIIPKPVWVVCFAHEQTLRDATLPVFSFLILKRLQHITRERLRKIYFVNCAIFVLIFSITRAINGIGSSKAK